ncbi:MAG: hypothetical protein QF541_16070 [Lentisphaeria bacterium]|jgi:hypothetical protein|nr:hypothetical protein [Lentisphaeria bacterium]
MKMRMKILSVTVLSLAVGGAHAKDKIASRLKIPHPRFTLSEVEGATDVRPRGIKFPIS